MKKMLTWFVMLSMILATFGGMTAMAAGIGFSTTGTSLGALNFKDVISRHEFSGMAASHSNANVLYTHNDSGDTARFFAMNTDGELLGIYALDNATATDWEDMAVGPGPGGNSYVYLGDIGDNGSNRDGTTRPRIAVYRTAEPTINNAGNPPDPNTVSTTTISSSNWEKIIMKYPDGPHNTEAMMVDPQTGDLFIVLKEHASGDPNLRNRVYKATKSQLDQYAGTGNVLQLTQVALVAPRKNSVRIVGPTAADISADGSMIIVKNLEEAFVWPRGAGQSVDSVLANNPESPIYVAVAVGQTGSVGNGEAVTFAADGSKFYTVTEGGNPFGYFNRTSSDSQAPTVPQSLNSPGQTETSIDLAWNASTDNDMVKSYDVWKNGSYLATAYSNSYTVTGLTAGTSYNFKVKATDISGNASALSSQLTVSTSGSGSGSTNLLIAHTATAPTIDGKWTSVDSWGDATGYQTNNVISGTVTDDTDLLGNIRALWDSTNLYLWVNVSDDAKYNDSGSSTHDDDGVEVYIDGDNSKSSTYDANDFRYIFRWNDSTVLEKAHNATTGVTFAKTDATDGYKMEIKIPWSTIGVSSPGTGTDIGFDLQINDDDNGGTREGKKAWFGTTDTAWQDPSQFGTAELQ
ncbi:MAG: large protein [Paenibacillaceae bacterium]|jgi:hypothetical protein|nr:large protein [Paenibacillaceae bacterium]